MLDPYSQSAILLYQSTTATSLDGSLINFVEFCDHPILFSIINKNTFSIYIINPYFEVNSFLSDIHDLSNDLDAPLYLFQYDLSCLQKYDNTFQVNFLSFFTRYEHISIDNNRFSDLEDFYSFSLPECYGSFFTNSMFVHFSQTGDPTDIINFIKSIMFSKLVLLIDLFSSYSFVRPIQVSFSVVFQGLTPISLPDHACIIDFETLGLDSYSDILLFSIFKGNSFTSYYLNTPTPDGQVEFREFIAHSLQFFDTIYVFNAHFESIFFPQITKFVDMKFNKYQYWVTARKLVHLPHYHLELDPGSGKNVPIWNRLYSIEDNPIWMMLILQRTLVNILTKLAILSSNEIKIPFYDPLMADLRRVRPTAEFFEQFGKINNNLVKKKVFFRPTEFFETYRFADGQFDEMYFFEEKNEDEEE